MIDNEDVNLAVIATPNSLHFDLYVCYHKRLRALIEKPVGLSSYDCVVLSYEAEKNNQRASLCFTSQTKPCYKIFEIISER